MHRNCYLLINRSNVLHHPAVFTLAIVKLFVDVWLLRGDKTRLNCQNIESQLRNHCIWGMLQFKARTNDRGFTPSTTFIIDTNTNASVHVVHHTLFEKSFNYFQSPCCNANNKISGY